MKDNFHIISGFGTIRIEIEAEYCENLNQLTQVINDFYDNFSEMCESEHRACVSVPELPKEEPPRNTSHEETHIVEMLRSFIRNSKEKTEAGTKDMRGYKYTTIPIPTDTFIEIMNKAIDFIIPF